MILLFLFIVLADYMTDDEKTVGLPRFPNVSSRISLT